MKLEPASLPNLTALYAVCRQAMMRIRRCAALTDDTKPRSFCASLSIWSRTSSEISLYSGRPMPSRRRRYSKAWRTTP